MAPEIINKSVYNEKVDVWSLGVITYMLLTGKRLFPGETSEEVKRNVVRYEIDFNSQTLKKVSKEARSFLKCCLNRDTSLRQTPKQLLAHNWLNNQNRESIASQDAREVLTNLYSFSNASKF
jgi:serine/threonine protein kinase